MTQDEIMELWEKVVKYAPSEVRLHDFAKLVAAKEREECEKRAEIALVSNHAPWYARQDVIEAIRAMGRQ